ncbi:MAG: DNA polymerase IV [Ruminococcaceae bacterium]|nr:DNA polymerase IV [Oscillospiraceae bacterium]
MARTILHCDMNNFFASVETVKDPSLAGKPLAVCGSIEERHGIVLAKNELAKAYGITTGEPVVRARAKCRNLTVVSPHYEDYLKYSALARTIYSEYTDLVEPYGVDECWLDVTGSERLFGDGKTIAEALRARIKRELGLTISVGVSFNKVFAKLGSDLKKPDAVTVIPEASFRDTVFPLKVSELFGVGRSTAAELFRYGIFTIGQLATAYPPLLQQRFGKNGWRMRRDAAGENTDPVLSLDTEIPLKSIGHGTTPRQDMASLAEAWPIMLALCEEIGHRLLACRKRARGVSLSLRDNTLKTRQYQCHFPIPTDSYSVIASAARSLLAERHVWERPLRSLSVTAIDLIGDHVPYQADFFCDAERLARSETIDRVMDAINIRYGKGKIRYGVLVQNPRGEVGRGIGFGRREELR